MLERNRPLLLVLALFCGVATAQDAPVTESSDSRAMDAMPDHGDMRHGNHDPGFGGLVLMYAMQHFEIVARPEGGIELHLSDAMRTPMPAVSVSEVTVEIAREGEGFEYVPMTVSEAGDYWKGPSAPLDDPRNTTVHLAFVAFGDPYVYALPLAVVQRESTRLGNEEAGVPDPAPSGDAHAR